MSLDTIQATVARWSYISGSGSWGHDQGLEAAPLPYITPPRITDARQRPIFIHVSGPWKAHQAGGGTAAPRQRRVNLVIFRKK